MMKKIILVLLLAAPTFVKAEEIKVKVKGLVCSFCAQGILKHLKQESAIDKIEVAMRESSVILTPKKQIEISDEKIKALITDAGFSVDKIERSEKID